MKWSMLIMKVIAKIWKNYQVIAYNVNIITIYKIRTLSINTLSHKLFKKSNLWLYNVIKA